MKLTNFVETFKQIEQELHIDDGNSTFTIGWENYDHDVISVAFVKWDHDNAQYICEVHISRYDGFKIMQYHHEVMELDQLQQIASKLHQEYQTDIMNQHMQVSKSSNMNASYGAPAPTGSMLFDNSKHYLDVTEIVSADIKMDMFDKHTIFMIVQHQGVWKFSGSMEWFGFENTPILNDIQESLQEINLEYSQFSDQPVGLMILGFNADFPVNDKNMIFDEISNVDEVIAHQHLVFAYSQHERIKDITIKLVDNTSGRSKDLKVKVEDLYKTKTKISNAQHGSDTDDNHNLYSMNKYFMVSDKTFGILTEISNEYEPQLILGYVTGLIGIAGLQSIMPLNRKGMEDSGHTELQAVECFINTKHENIPDNDFFMGLAVISIDPDAVKSHAYFDKFTNLISQANPMFSVEHPIYHVQWDQLTDSVSSISCISNALHAQMNLQIVGESVAQNMYAESAEIMDAIYEQTQGKGNPFDHIHEIHKELDKLKQ